MAQKSAGDNAKAINTRETIEQPNIEKADESFSWPNVIPKGSKSLTGEPQQMTPKDLDNFGAGNVENDFLQFQQPKSKFDPFITENGCKIVRGEEAIKVMEQQDQMALDDLAKPIGSNKPASEDQQKFADEIAKLAPLNAQGVDEDVINGNERIREIFRSLDPDAAQNVIDTANRALQKDGYRLVKSANGQIRLAAPGPEAPDPSIHIKEPDCNLS